MADQKCVAIKADVKDIFDKALKPAVTDQITETVKALVAKTKGLAFDKNCKDGWLLNATVVSLKVDNKDNPTTLEAAVTIDGLPLFGTVNPFKAKGHSKTGGVNAKKMAEEVTSFVDAVLKDVMTKQVLPQMLKS
jgi:hypothetical protein